MVLDSKRFARLTQKIFILDPFCMNMRKNTSKSAKQGIPYSGLLCRVLLFGIPPILLSLIGTALHIREALPLTVAEAAYFGGMLEHHVAAIAILTTGAYLAERLARSCKEQRKK